jgi:hypothetical protein
MYIIRGEKRTMDEKEEFGRVYGFEPGEALDLFYDGFTEAGWGDPKKAVNLFEASIEKDPKNPYTRMFHMIVMEECIKPGEETMKKLSNDWLAVAKESGNERQIKRAEFSVKYYASTQEERAGILSSVIGKHK